MKTRSLLAVISLAIFLASCAFALPVPLAATQTPIIEKTTSLPPAPTRPEPVSLVCNKDFARHELTVPYKQDKYNPQPLCTFSPDEFTRTLSELGIASACVPLGVDAPYLLFDWKAADSTAQQGRMTILSFDAWRTAWIVYATYDFAKGTEYETFATPADYDAVTNTSSSGFERIFTGLCYGKCSVYKTFIYPFADHYIAVTFNLGAYDYGTTVDAQVNKFTAGEYPVELQADLARFETLVRGLEFLKP